MIERTESQEELVRQLGENPSPEALMEHAKATLGYVEPLTMDADTEYPYTVTLTSYDVQDNFYDEMESPGSRGYAPERVVECSDRMPLCRSTTYLITPIEAARLELDPRVQAVQVDSQFLGVKPRPLGSQFSAFWDKSGSTTSDMKNWGLLRCWNRTTLPNWGSDGTEPNKSGTITLTSTGKNVDVVVFDGNMDANHPEYARNPNGTGGSRINQINWWAYNPAVTGQPAGVYNYGAGSAGNNGHGYNVGGIMAGNTCGWARNSTIYNISPYGEQTNGTSTPNLTQLVNYIRYWHNSVKTRNPVTGIKNPTVVNMSFGLFGNTFPKNGSILMCNRIDYRGTIQNHPTSPPAGQTSLQATYNFNWTLTNFYNGGVQVYADYANTYGVILFFYTLQDAAASAAIIDGMNEGIIWGAAAGNQWGEAGVLSGDPDFNNNLNVAYATFGTLVLYAARYHNQFPVPASTESGTPGTDSFKGVIVTGNIDQTVNQQVQQTSSAGRGITVWAPGTGIMSPYTSGVPDPRNASYFMSKLTGTSMASPQVMGIIASLCEIYPNMSQMDAYRWARYYAQVGVIPDFGTPLPPGPVSERGLRGAQNLFMGYYNDRPITGNVWPQKRWWLRPDTGLAYPRQTIRRYSTG